MTNDRTAKFPATTNPDGSLTLVGYALHLADDLENGGFDGIDTAPIDAALILADTLRALVDAWPGGDD